MVSSIFETLDYRIFLGQAYHRLRKNNPNLSLRGFARICGSTSPNFLKLVVDRKLNISEKALKNLSRELELNSNEEEYFIHLAAFDHAKTFEEKDFHYQQLLKLKVTATASKIDQGQYKYYSKWFHSAVRGLLGYYKFHSTKGDYNDLGKQLFPTISGQQAESSIKLLKKLGFICVNNQGYFEQTSAVVTSGPEARSVEILKYQMETMNLAKETLNKVGVENRDVSTLTLNVSEPTSHLIREKIIQLRKEVMGLAEKDQNDDRIMQLNIQFFPMSKIRKKNG